jgi:hypothetical protein
MSTLLLALSGLAMLVGVVSIFQPRFRPFFTLSAHGLGARFWLLLSLVFWGSYRLFYDADIHALELIAIFTLAVIASRFCRRALLLPALRKEKTLYAYGVIGIAFGFALRPFLQGNMDHIVHEYKWKLIVILIPALFLALLYDVLNRKFSGLLGRLLGTALYDSCRRKISASLGQLLGALGNSVLILAGMLASIILSSALFDRQFAPYELLPPLLMLYCCLMMSDIIARIIGGELHE